MKKDRAISNAMNHPYKLGAGAKKRRKLGPEKIFETVMKEWKRGTLMSGGGQNVSSQSQALAIAFSEQESKKKRLRKK